MSDSLQLHRLQLARLLCPSLSSEVHSDACPLSWWCHQPSHPLLPPFPPAFSLSQHQGLFQCSAFFMVQLSHPYITTEKTIALSMRTFVGQVMSLLFNMLSRFVIAFLPRSKCLLISWLQSSSVVILEPPKIVSHCFHCFSIYLPWSDGTTCHDLSFLDVEF